MSDYANLASSPYTTLTMSDYDDCYRPYPNYSSMLFVDSKPESFQLGDSQDPQQYCSPSDLDAFGFDTISPSTLPDLTSYTLLATSSMNSRGPSSSDTAPLSPGLISPSFPTYTPTPVSPYLPQSSSWHMSNPQSSTEPDHPFSKAQRGPMVPQKRYKPHTSSDRRRYVDEVHLEEPIHFYMQKPDEAGIPLKDAMHGRFARLVARDEPMFVERGPSITVRLNWPGYQPWSRQIPTRDFRNPPGPITRAKLAKNVAKSVARFISEHNGPPMEEDGEPIWAVGPGPHKIDMFDLVLVRLDHVAKGSWQAQLQLIHPRP